MGIPRLPRRCTAERAGARAGERGVGAAGRAADQAINDFQSETAEITGAPEPLAARLTLWLLASMLALGIGLAAVLPIERVVAARGRLITEAPTIVVQPLEPAIIRGIAVRAGQEVTKGQILATLDPTFSSADASRLEREATSLGAEIRRLEAELAGQPFAPAGPDGYDQLQRAVWGHRQAELAAGLANFDQRIEATLATIARSEAEGKHLRRRLGLVSEIEGMRSELQQREAGSRLSTLMASDNRLEVARALAASDGAGRTAGHELAALRAEREVFVQKWRARVAEELVGRRVALDRTREELAKASRRRDLVELRAIDDAVVLQLADVSVGSVLQSGQRLMTLVPRNATLQVEADIAGADQGFIAPGDPVRIKFDALRYLEHGTAAGRVRSVSGDAFSARGDDAPARPPFYRAFVDLEPVRLRKVPADFRLVPGMPLTAEIIVGSRTILSYFVEGALKSLDEGMREP